MHPGEIFAEGIIVMALVVGGTWLVWIMIKARDDLRRADQRDEATTRGTGGGRPSTSAGRRSTHTQQRSHPSSHDGEASL